MVKDTEKVVRLLKTVRGQVDGLLKMVEDKRYCIDISTQILATQAVLKTANMHIIEGHMETCVREAFAKGDADDKMNEILQLISKMSK